MFDLRRKAAPDFGVRRADTIRVSLAWADPDGDRVDVDDDDALNSALLNAAAAQASAPGGLCSLRLDATFT